jgi:hypothetical protein
MTTHIKIKSDRGTEVHFKGMFDDHTLCGLSTSSDKLLGISIIGDVKQKVNCEDCKRIVTFCQTIDKKEF